MFQLLDLQGCKNFGGKNIIFFLFWGVGVGTFSHRHFLKNNIKKDVKDITGWWFQPI